ncbi:MAG: ATP synthase F1 subunit delta [Elusimicrobiota bacterium]|jgi:F-type H+-transporting ATPase subunit delta|nr:ATP synthase F1 subunit delta [Elusimicrobiota bacterium]
MKPNTLALARRYARAYDSVAKDNKEAASNLQAYQNALTALDAARGALINPVLPFSVKEELLCKILAQDKAAAFIKLLVLEKRFPLARGIEEELQNLLDAREGVTRVQITAAAELPAAEKEKLNAALNRYFGGQTAARYEVDKALLAGVKIRRGDLIIDGSAQGRVTRLTKILTDK